MANSVSHELGWSTVMICILFITNAFLFALFQYIKFTGVDTTEETQLKKRDKVEKELSKPFLGTVDCFYNLTLELLRTGFVMCLTYVCEKHWIFDHSTKSYSRDLFMFVCLLFFAYGFYTLKPVHDLTLLSREQTEEWKGWMQFIFLLYHYFHAEEVYNSVRVMITCYVWMTGFGNFSFFFVKQDFGWLRVVQMLWRLNFSVLLLMWTHGNTWILYYICPMHTFYFLMVFVTMYVFSSVNHSKWGIRLKLIVVAIIIFLVWDYNHGIFDFVFAFLGTESVTGATLGSVWEYYFRTSLDHWSSLLGMVFAVNFPLAEQYFVLAKGKPLAVAAVLMAATCVWWYFKFYTLEKLEYNLYHSYTAIIPLSGYIFFRNITPFVRSSVSMSMHDLGKTTLETYLLQHHIWLTSNAKTLLTIVPGHPWVNFAFASVLFFYTAKELYRLTMSLRGMIVPDDKAIALRNCIGAGVVVFVCYIFAQVLVAFQLISTLNIVIVSLLLFLAVVFLFLKFARITAVEAAPVHASVRKAYLVAGVLFVVLSLLSFTTARSASLSLSLSQPQSAAITTESAKSCLQSLSSGEWSVLSCDDTVPGTKLAFCEKAKWTWSTNTPRGCSLNHLSPTVTRLGFKNKKVVFLGDSVVRFAYQHFNKLLSATYDPDNVTSVTSVDKVLSLKHSDQVYSVPGINCTVHFYWAPYVKNITTLVKGAAGDADLVVAGAALWDALYIKDLGAYKAAVESLSGALASLGPRSKSRGAAQPTSIVWMQPTTVVDLKLNTEEKQKYITEKAISAYRQAFGSSSAPKVVEDSGGVVLQTEDVCRTRHVSTVDGVHYGPEVYSVIAQMVGNSYSLRYPSLFVKPAVKKLPKPTGSMSFPIYGLCELALVIVLLATMDSFLGIGYLSLLLFGRSLDWEAAYGPLLRSVLRTADRAAERASAPATSPTVEEGLQETDALVGQDA